MIEQSNRPGIAASRPRVIWWDEPAMAPPRDGAPPPRTVSGGWFAAAVAMQLLALAWLPADKLVAASTGRTVYLQAASYDPVDLLRGRYVDLAYAIEEPGALMNVPGRDGIDWAQGRTVYVSLAPASGPARLGEPLPWLPVAVDAAPPARPATGRMVLQGQVRGVGIRLGLDRYFIPDAKGESVQAAMANARDRTLVATRVDAEGRAVVTGLNVAGRAY